MDDQNNDAAPTGTDLVTSDEPRIRTIVVNGREHLFAGDRIGHGALARLAFPTLTVSGGRALTASFGAGPPGRERGVVAFGGTVEVVEGQRFNVSVTDRS